MYAEDLDLRPDDEHARVHGKGGTVRTVLPDDRCYVALLALAGGVQQTGRPNAVPSAVVTGTAGGYL